MKVKDLTKPESVSMSDENHDGITLIPIGEGIPKYGECTECGDTIDFDEDDYGYGEDGNLLCSWCFGQAGDEQDEEEDDDNGKDIP